MHTSIALLRGINFGGRNRLSMKDLTRDLDALRCAEDRGVRIPMEG